MSQQKPIISTSFSYETLEETLDIKPKGAQLHIGIPKETAFQENRIALTPEAVGVLVSNGHNVIIEHNAGEAAHYRDRDYSEDRGGDVTTRTLRGSDEIRGVLATQFGLQFSADEASALLRKFDR